MKSLLPTKASPDLADEVRRARHRLAKAEGKLAEAKEQLRLARQHRKAAKQAARQAKKQTRLAKERVGRAEAALAKLEAKLAQPHHATVRTKPRKITPKKTATDPRQENPVAAAPIRQRKILKITPLVSRRIKTKPVVSLAGEATKTSNAVSTEIEAPIAVISPLENKPTQQIVKDVEEIFTRETGTSACATPETEAIALPDQPASQPNINAQENL